MYSSPVGFEAQVMLHENPYYMSRLWVNFIHIFFALVAYAGAASALLKRSPALALLGFLWFLLWGFTELIGVSVLIFAVNRTWRAEYMLSSPEMQEIIRTNIEGFEAIWGALFFLLLVAFLLGTSCFGFAALRETGLTRIMALLFLLAVPLTLVIMLDRYMGFSLSTWISWSYPILQPLSRFIMGYWLWKWAGDMSNS